MPLKDKITEDMKAAMRAKDSARPSTVRLLLAAMKQKEVDEPVVYGQPIQPGVIHAEILRRMAALRGGV